MIFRNFGRFFPIPGLDRAGCSGYSNSEHQKKCIDMKSLMGVLIVLNIAITMFIGGVSSANDQAKLNGEQIKEYLSDSYVKGNYKGQEWKSFFNANGDTHYSKTNGRPSNGRWKAEGDRYCSQWPPSASWDCYFITANGDELTFVPEHGGDNWPAVRVLE